MTDFTPLNENVMAEHKIAVISDTHSLLRPEVIRLIGECEFVFHAGDIADRKTYDKIQTLSRGYYVKGNADKNLQVFLPEELEFELFGFRFYMIHNKRLSRKNLSKLDFFIYGHSHKYNVQEKDGIVYLNPGSCGPGRFHQPVTAAVLKIDEQRHDYTIEKIDLLQDLQPESQKLPAQDMDRLISGIMKDMDAGYSVQIIAERNRTEETFVNQILQIYTTHPGIDVLGIMNRMDILGK